MSNKIVISKAGAHFTNRECTYYFITLGAASSSSDSEESSGEGESYGSSTFFLLVVPSTSMLVQFQFALSNFIFLNL